MSSQGSTSSRMSIGRIIALIVVSVIALVFIFQNFQSVPVKLLVFSFDLPMWVVMVLFFVLGMIFGGVVRSGLRKLRGAPPRR